MQSPAIKLIIFYLFSVILTCILCERPGKVFIEKNDLWPESFYHGYININKKIPKDKLFYYMYPSRIDPETAPLLIFLQGGPGCSGSFGQIMEQGPIKVNKNGTKAYLNPYAWNTRMNMIMPDSPQGTVFSKSQSDKDIPATSKQVGEQLFKFMQGFFELYPEFKGRPFYIAGESYAGKYIPYFGHHILSNIQDNPAFNLKGVIIGDGYVDPLYQYPANIEYALKNHIINSDLAKKLEAQMKTCVEKQKARDKFADSEFCSPIQDEIIGQTVEKDFINFNYYDIRLT